MEVLYKKLYDKYNKFKSERFSQLDHVNDDVENKFLEYVTAADAYIDQIKDEKDKLLADLDDLRNEVASLRSAKELQYEDCQKLLSEERRKNKELTQALENLKKLQQDGNVQNEEIDTPLHTPRKRRRFSLEAMDSGPVQVVSSEPRIQSCPSPIKSAGRCNSLFQIVVESLTGMEVSSSSQYNGMALCALHQSSGYSFELISVKKGTADEPGLETQFLLYQPSSLGTFERVAPDWMRESIVFSLSMCPVFFERVFRVIKLG